MLTAFIFALILTVYVGAHAGLYFLLVHFFAVNSVLAKLLLLVSLVFLALSFFIATYLSHLDENTLTTNFYFFAGSWIGLLTNLILFLMVGLMVAKFAKQINPQIIAVFAIACAFIYSAYGIWNAFNPIVKNVEVTLADLPESWKGKKIVQITDVHLGHIYSDRYMSKVADQINSLKPDIILITGDLFDGTDGNLQKFVAPLNKLEASYGIYFATGNHEAYLGVSNTQAVISQTKIQHLSDQLKNINGLQIIGIDYPERGRTKDVVQAINNLSNFDRKMPSVLLWHVPTQIDAIKNAGISLQLSGHTHKGQLFPFGLITYLTYKGYDYGLFHEGDYYLYTSSGVGGWGPPMRTQKRSEIVQIILK